MHIVRRCCLLFIEWNKLCLTSVLETFVTKDFISLSTTSKADQGSAAAGEISAIVVFACGRVAHMTST